MESNYISEESFDRLIHANVPLAKGEYEGCTFSNCDFLDANLMDFRFLDTEFLDCNVSNVILHGTSFQDVRFKGCKMLGIRFEDCDQFAFAATFEGCRLDHSTFYRMKLNKTSFTDSQLHGVDFSEADLKNIVLRNCDLLHATFERTSLEYADLRGSVHYSFDPDINRIKGAKFSLPDVLRLFDKYQIIIDP